MGHGVDLLAAASRTAEPGERGMKSFLAMMLEGGLELLGRKPASKEAAAMLWHGQSQECQQGEGQVSTGT